MVAHYFCLLFSLSLLTGFYFFSCFSPQLLSSSQHLAPMSTMAEVLEAMEEATEGAMEVTTMAMAEVITMAMAEVITPAMEVTTTGKEVMLVAKLINHYFINITNKFCLCL